MQSAQSRRYDRGKHAGTRVIRDGKQMASKFILHMITPLKHMSPFDVNMALDAGFDAALPYTNVDAKEVTGLVQDAMFSRPPQDAVRTGIFIGGRDAILALDMLDAGKKALFKPFELSIFADPAGSFTTAAAMVACVEKLLKKEFKRELKGTKIVVYGATGVVGFTSGVIASLEGAAVTLAGYDGAERVERAAQEIKTRFDTSVKAADASTPDKIRSLLQQSEIALCAGRAGVQILSEADVKAAGGLLVAADVNAVPPAGVAGLDPQNKGDPLDGAKVRGIGALAIGNVKYQTESGLFKRMVEAKEALALDFRDAFRLAREIA
ncbi:MAG: methylene-tetrahydromethanopterin dehydrogenase [Methylobacteriaceae bacterium]|jgi:methylene-tetrahydromethanopterin dehydrogenase|nr:methylene-tetrahydromethanopterin dehydrogenase [Methylobacteriaceae bacterium]